VRRLLLGAETGALVARGAAGVTRARGRDVKTLTREQIQSCIRLGQAEYAANVEYASNRYHPERGGPAMARLVQARAEHDRLFESPRDACTDTSGGLDGASARQHVTSEAE
jgi:hypothetical protein